MPWKDETPMSQRLAFLERVQVEGANISALCREFGISRKTAYKWMARMQAEGTVQLADRSRQPHSSPTKTAAHMEEQVLAVRTQHPAWGGRKIRKVLEDRTSGKVPVASTITAILRRHEQIDPEATRKHQPLQRFEWEHPNDLLQMDFKGYFALSQGGYCHPLTLIDDHSRFLLGLRACPDETRQTVQAQLSEIFRRFGLPERMLMDNGAPWGHAEQHRFTGLSAWLMRMGILILHGRPRHPQTQGKDERLHRSLQEEVLRQHALADLQQCQTAFDKWWQIYNYVRPHEALQLQTPASRYEPSPRPFPDPLPPVTYPEQDLVRKVDLDGHIYFRNRVFRISKAFRHQPVALRPIEPDGCFAVFFCKQQVATINLREHNC